MWVSVRQSDPSFITSVHNVTLVTAFNLPTETSIPIWPLTRMKGMSVRSHTPPVHFVHDHLPLTGCLQNQYSGIIKSCILHIVQIHLLQNRLFSPVPPIYWQFTLSKILKPLPPKNHEKPRKTKESCCSLMLAKLPKIQILKVHEIYYIIVREEFFTLSEE